MIELDMIEAALSEVIDPEIGLPITELGLVYGVEATDGHVVVEMTTTTPLCPLGSYLGAEVERRLADVPGVEAAEVRFTHDPPWGPERIRPAGRRALGWPA